jgi:3-oxoacyl-[acyl-carrier-protein] synthase II
VIGSGPGVHRLEDYDRWLDADGRLDTRRMGRELADVEPESLMRNAAEQPAAILAARHGLGGPVHAVTTACSAANQALGLAYRSVRRGEADWIVSGGTDGMINPMGLVFFVLLGAGANVDDDPSVACKPFDRRRSGLVLGEGAGAAVFEELEHARARGARIYAEVVGYGASMDAHRTTAPWRDGRGAAAAMAAALHDAGLDPEDVDYVCAHGTGTKRNDPAEVAGIRTVFGEHANALAVSALKGGLGHLLSGAGGVAFACTALAVARDMVPPTANLTEPDASCDLDFVPGRGRAQRVRAAINNAFAFGGQNSTIVLRKYDEEGA